MINNQTLEDENQETKALEKIRPELNIEKWSIWQPAHSKNQPAERTVQREITLPDGSKVLAKVEIGFTNKGALTTEDQKTYYALIKNWEEKGRPTKQTSLSLRELAKVLNKKWGTNVIESLSKSLTRLRVTPFIWTNSYYNNMTKETVEVLDTFNILSELKISKRKSDGAVNQATGYYHFNGFILNNLLGNHTKPLLVNVVFSFNNEIAQLLYIHLDLILASRSRYERRTKELFDDLGLKGAEYKYPSGRKRILEKALTEIQGTQLTTGFISSATIEETKDGKDYKVVFQKVVELEKLETPLEREEIQELQSQKTFPAKDPATLKAEEVEARLNALSKEEHLALREKVTAEILNEHPLLRGHENWVIFQKLVELGMKKELG